MADNRLAEWIHDTDLALQMKLYTKQSFTRNEILVYLRLIKIITKGVLGAMSESVCGPVAASPIFLKDGDIIS